MKFAYRRARPAGPLLALCSVALAVPLPSFADGSAAVEGAATPAQPPAASEAVSKALEVLLEQHKTLIAQQKAMLDLLDKKGVVTPRQAAELRQGMDAMAGQADTTVKAARAALASASPGPLQPKPVPGAVNIPYIPDYVKQQIADQVRAKVLADASSATPPRPGSSWLDRLTISGDIRLRGEYDGYERSNSNQIVDFNSLLASPFDVNSATNGGALPPTLNTRENRDRLRVRARLDVAARLSDEVSAEFRISTGTTGTPGSQNQTLGNDFNKDSIVLDRANLALTEGDFHATGGRIENPFFSTDLLWSRDLSFDGVAVGYHGHDHGALAGFATVGAFPLAFTDLNFPSNAIDKGTNFQKWLVAGQIGLDWTPEPAIAVRAAAAYYDFLNYSGKRSTPCVSPSLGCGTDSTRPLYTQFGNSFFGLRDLSLVASGSPTPQLYGLASPFRVLDLNGQVDWAVLQPLHLIVDFDYALNLGYSRSRLQALPIENNVSASGEVQSGDTAYLARITFGYPTTTEWLQWNFSAGYKYLEPDAVVAAFNDTDFHLGGTNAKGYILSGNLGLYRNTWLSVRWFSANEVMGAPYGVDVLQLDLNAKF